MTYDRHAERALLFARAEAAERNQPRIGSEYLLIGLLREGEGGAAHILAELGVSLDRARTRLFAIPRRRPLPPGSPGWEPPGFTSDLRAKLTWAEQEAKRLE